MLRCFIWILLLLKLCNSTLLAQEKPQLHGSLASLFKQLDRDSNWKKVAEIEVSFDTFHPQGFALVGDHLFISSVEVRERTQRFTHLQNGLDRTAGKGIGHVFKVDLRGNLKAHVEIGEGEIYHPGGIDYDGSKLWIPVAEYRPNSQSIIYSMHPDTLKPIKRLQFDDHIGAIISDSDNSELHALNWGSRRYYSWKIEKLSKIREEDTIGRLNPAHYIDYQDCQYIDQQAAICTGLAGYYQESTHTRFALGGLELIDLRHSQPTHQVPFPFWTEDGLPMTQNPVALELDGSTLRLYAMPEDNQSRLFIFEANIPAQKKGN